MKPSSASARRPTCRSGRNVGPGSSPCSLASSRLPTSCTARWRPRRTGRSCRSCDSPSDRRYVMAQGNLLDLTIIEAAAQLEGRRLSPVELTEAMLQRIASVDKQIRAYITVCDAQAREVARAAEGMIQAGYYLGPLHGIPVALKDNIYTCGVRTTAGSKILADFIPAADATVAARLKRAAAIIMGKTNMHEFSWGGTTANPHQSACRYPWNLARFPDAPRGGSRAARGRGPRVGVIRDYSLPHVQKAVGDAVRAALKPLEGLGAQVEEIAMPSMHGNISAQLTIESCEPSAYPQQGLRTRAADYGDDVRTLLESGEMYLATHYIQAQRYRSLLRSEERRVGKECRSR